MSLTVFLFVCMVRNVCCLSFSCQSPHEFVSFVCLFVLCVFPWLSVILSVCGSVCFKLLSVFFLSFCLSVLFPLSVPACQFFYLFVLTFLRLFPCHRFYPSFVQSFWLSRPLYSYFLPVFLFGLSVSLSLSVLLQTLFNFFPFLSVFLSDPL